MSSPAFRRAARGPATRLLGVLLAAGLAGCNAERAVRQPDYPDDFRARHPVAVTRGPASLELELGPEAAGLSERQKAEAYAFAYGYRKSGEGPLAVLMPAGTANEAAARRALPELRVTLARAGIGPEAVDIRPYGPAGGAAAPIRLSYTALRAHTNTCGLWPDDLQGDQQNRSYYNFGCASQQNLAAMVRDPADLVSPQPETRPYATRRQEALGKYGKGEDPSTNSKDGQKGNVSKVGQ